MYVYVCIYVIMYVRICHPDYYDFRDTVKGKKYSIWKLSDLSGQSTVVSLFLFGTAFQSHWKTTLGTIIAILNPGVMSDKLVCF